MRFIKTRSNTSHLEQDRQCCCYLQADLVSHPQTFSGRLLLAQGWEIHFWLFTLASVGFPPLSLCSLMLSQRLFIGSASLLCPTAEHAAYQTRLMDCGVFGVGAGEPEKGASFLSAEKL